MVARLASSGLAEHVQSLGGDLSDLIAQIGEDPEILTHNEYLTSWGAMCDLFELCAITFKQPNFGIIWAQKIPLDFRGSGSTLLQLALSENLRDFANTASRYQSLHNTGVSYRLEEDEAAGEAKCVIALHPLSPSCRQAIEHIMGTMAFMSHRYVKNLRFKRVTFQHSAPEDLSDFETVFRCPVEFNAPRYTMVIDRSFLGVEKNNLTTALLKPFLEAYFELKIKKKRGRPQSISMMTYQMIPAILGLGSSDQKHVADILNLHPKKFQRLLKDEGNTYADILDDVRKSIAERLLRDSDISVETIAGMLDYAAGTTFAKAAHRWFGMAPTQYRAHVRNLRS